MNAGRFARLVSCAALLALALVAPARADDAHHAPPPAPAAPANTRALPLGVIGRMIERAAPGATIEVPPGVYREHIRIDKPITLIGVDRPVIDGGGSGDIIEITAPDVTLRGFLIRNTGIDLERENAAIRAVAPRVTLEDNILEDILFGIDLREAPDSVVRGNHIGGKDLDIARRGDGLRLWRADRALIEGNEIHSGRDAILWYSTGIIVRGNNAHDCRYGLHLMYSDEVTIEDNHFTGNSVGVYLMYSSGVELHRNRLIRNRGPSGYGIGLKEADRFSVSGNLLIGNRVGVYIDGSPFTRAQPGAFTRNTIAYNDIGFTFLPSARNNVLTENSFIDNIDQVSVAGRGSLDANRFWEGEVGNFWSDYTGYDQDGDGVGDFVHESQTLFENMMDKEPKLRLFLFSPAQQAIEFIGRAVPAVRPEAKFIDEVPLMRPIPSPLHVPASRADSLRLGAAGAMLAAIGAGTLAVAHLGARGSRGKRVAP
jgi:nitrous oxidase accessory protein